MYEPIWEGPFAAGGKDGPMKGRAANILKKFYPMLQSEFAFDDLMQESWLIFNKCRTSYSSVDNGKWFGKLFETALTRRLIDLVGRGKRICRGGGRPYNTPYEDGALVCGSEGVDTFFDTLRQLTQPSLRVLKEIAEDPCSIERVDRKSLSSLRKELLSIKEKDMAAKPKTPSSKAPAKKPAAAKPATAKKPVAATPAKKKASPAAPAKKPAAVSKDLEKALLEATGESSRYEDEDLQNYTDRVAEAVSSLEDEKFEALPKEAKAWYKKAEAASEADKPIPPFVKGGGSAKEKKEKKEKGDPALRETSGTYKALKYIYDNPEASLAEILKGASSAGVDLADSRIRDTFILVRAVQSLR